MYLENNLMDIDELFDFSGDRDDVFSSATTDLFHNVTSSTTTGYEFQYSFNNTTISTDFTDHFCLPSDDVAELEWLSKFVDDSVTNFPENNIAGTINIRPENTSFHSRSRSKRTRAAPSNDDNKWMTSSPVNQISEAAETENGVVRRCTHCLSEKTPQWRTGPLGPKTLCNACGVRFKSGRLVPEYRPAASPTFVLTQHSNSHRKVMELRRQKEVTSVHHQQQQHYHHQYHQQQQVASSEHQMYGGGNHHHHHHHRQHQGLHHGSNYEIS